MNQTDYDQFLIFYPPLLSGQISDAQILLNCPLQEKEAIPFIRPLYYCKSVGLII